MASWLKPAFQLGVEHEEDLPVRRVDDERGAGQVAGTTGPVQCIVVVS
jgi:hypothetical protein